MTRDETKLAMAMLGGSIQAFFGRELEGAADATFAADELYLVDRRDGLVIGRLEGETLHAWSSEGARRFEDLQAAV